MESKTSIFSISAPTSVRVARWAAIAALITALGSVFDTVWTNKPWWADQPSTPASVAAEPWPSPTPTPVYVSGPKMAKFNTDEFKTPATTSPVEKPKFHIEKWLLVGSLGVVFVYLFIEGGWSRLRKKLLSAHHATLSAK